MFAQRLVVSRSIAPFSIAPFSIATFSIATFSIAMLSIAMLVLVPSCAADDTATTDTSTTTDASGDVVDAGCSDSQPCGVGSFCNSAGTCCAALGCNPQCPDGVLIDANGCETCQCAPVTLQIYTTCGDVVCRTPGKPIVGVQACTSEKVGDACSSEGKTCDAGAGCGQLLVCAKSDPKAVGCAISRAHLKADISYVDDAERQHLAQSLLDTRLATYRYREAGPSGQRHLGFIIEDQPDSPAVDARRDMVDLYGYLSQAVATLQVQQRQITALRAELDELRGRCDAPTPPLR